MNEHKTSNKNFYKPYNYLNLPNCTFFESSGTYLNTEGFFKKNIKVIKPIKQTKEDWQIIRKILYCSKKINFISNFKYNSLINFNCNSKNNFKSFTDFIYYPNDSLTKLSCHSFKKRSNCNIFFEKSFKMSKNKIYNSQLKLWISDFYIGGKDFYSKYSLTMVKCSKLFRLTSTNFNYTILKTY
jgi:predicted molibdopterin-dependent oxidoreductase YjgC